MNASEKFLHARRRKAFCEGQPEVYARSTGSMDTLVSCNYHLSMSCPCMSHDIIESNRIKNSNRTPHDCTRPDMLYPPRDLAARLLPEASPEPYPHRLHPDPRERTARTVSYPDHTDHAFPARKHTSARNTPTPSLDTQSISRHTVHL